MLLEARGSAAGQGSLSPPRGPCPPKWQLGSASLPRVGSKLSVPASNPCAEGEPSGDLATTSDASHGWERTRQRARPKARAFEPEGESRHVLRRRPASPASGAMILAWCVHKHKRTLMADGKVRAWAHEPLRTLPVPVFCPGRPYCHAPAVVLMFNTHNSKLSLCASSSPATPRGHDLVETVHVAHLEHLPILDRPALGARYDPRQESKRTAGEMSRTTCWPQSNSQQNVISGWWFVVGRRPSMRIRAMQPIGGLDSTR